MPLPLLWKEGFQRKIQRKIFFLTRRCLNPHDRLLLPARKSSYVENQPDVLRGRLIMKACVISSGAMGKEGRKSHGTEKNSTRRTVGR